MSEKCSNVKCGVDTCDFYENNYCNAGAIEVNTQGAAQVYRSYGTQCVTFRPQSNSSIRSEASFGGTTDGTNSTK